MNPGLVPNKLLKFNVTPEESKLAERSLNFDSDLCQNFRTKTHIEHNSIGESITTSKQLKKYQKDLLNDLETNQKFYEQHETVETPIEFRIRQR